MKTLLLYSSCDGQTKKIIEFIADVLRVKMAIDVCDLCDTHHINLSEYQSVIIGASIRYGYFNRQLEQFVRKYSIMLNDMPSAFFSVSLTARKKDKNTPLSNGYTRKFLSKTVWKPLLCGVFAGALCYPKYGWFDRMMIQFIMKITGGETDRTKEVEYTDWLQVEQFAEQFRLILEKKAATR